MAADPNTEVKIIDLTPAGEGRAQVNLGSSVVAITTRYNYGAECWTMDVADVDGNPILSGLMLIPGVDILDAYQQEKKTLGGMVLAERSEDAYREAGSLGVSTKLLWFPPGSEVVIP